MYTHIYVHTHTYVHIYIYIYTHIWTYIYIYLHIYMYTYTFIDICMYMYMWTWAQQVAVGPTAAMHSPNKKGTQVFAYGPRSRRKFSLGILCKARCSSLGGAALNYNPEALHPGMLKANYGFVPKGGTGGFEAATIAAWGKRAWCPIQDKPQGAISWSFVLCVHLMQYNDCQGSWQVLIEMCTSWA